MSLRLVSICALLLSGSFGFPATKSQKASESQNDATRLNSGFVPSQVDSGSNPHNEPSAIPVFAEQNFFPSFFRPGQQLPPSRPFSTRLTGGSSSSRYLQSFHKSNSEESILGSGDFAVIKGGTFYPEGEEVRKPLREYFGTGSSFFDSTNSGRPFAQPFAQPLEAPHYSDDPFANFKDFADIAGLDTDFSQIVSSYKQHEPNNILEQLELIDQEKSQEQAHLGSTEANNHNKVSKAKTKLRLTFKRTKEPKKHETMKNVDPLLAES